MLNWAEEYLDYAKNNWAKITYGEKKGALSRLFKNIDADSNLAMMTPSLSMKHLMQEAKSRSGNAANKDRKNLAAGWEWGRKYINGFPQDILNPFKAVKKFPEKTLSKVCTTRGRFLESLLSGKRAGSDNAAGLSPPGRPEKRGV